MRRIHRIQTITIAWMTIEAAISLISAWKAQSPALLAFGGDSAIEVLSAMAVLWRFRVHVEPEKAEKRAARITGVLLFLLSAYVLVASILTLLGYAEPKPTYLGIGILIAALLIMPVAGQGKAQTLLSHQQRGIEGRRRAIVIVRIFLVNCPRWTGNRCSLAHSVADPIAALVITPLIIWEGREAIRGKSCECC
jgi:divalent metal cation (Fe/Co/Zn/Cd) transporter